MEGGVGWGGWLGWGVGWGGVVSGGPVEESASVWNSLLLYHPVRARARAPSVSGKSHSALKGVLGYESGERGE